MKRNLENELLKWRNLPDRKPLVLKGARQVGKTWLLKNFGKRAFKRLAYFSFDRDDAPRAAFANKDPRRIVEILEMLAGFKFVPGETLLVLDEIQESAQAVGALKYFGVWFDLVAQIRQTSDFTLFPASFGLLRLNRTTPAWKTFGGMRLTICRRTEYNAFVASGGGVLFFIVL